MDMKNYHTHTYRCKHAIGQDRDYIEEAIKAGYTELGFSDHVPWDYDTDFISPARMSLNQLDDYVNSIRQLKEEYKEKISIKIGFEVEYFPRYMDYLVKMLKDYSIDYIILGHHYSETDEINDYNGYPPKSTKQVKTYVKEVLEAMDTGLFSYVAHPDLIFYDENDPIHIQELEKICIKAKELDIPLEFNLLGYKGHRPYPSPKFFQLCAKHHNRIIIGTDAHDPLSLSDTKTYESAVQYLKTLGLEMTEDIRFLEDI